MGVWDSVTAILIANANNCMVSAGATWVSILKCYIGQVGSLGCANIGHGTLLREGNLKKDLHGPLPAATKTE
jgi:hypothetical protein